MSYQIGALIPNFSILLFICKILGIYPHSLQEFQRNKVLRSSKLGTIVVFGVMIGMLSLYNLVIYSFADGNGTTKGRQSTVTFVIGLFLNYIGPVMVAVDQLSAIFNQAKLQPVFDRIANVDEKLYKEGIAVDNTIVQKQIFIMIGITIVSEISITLSTYAFLVNYVDSYALLWFVSCVPTLYNSLDKIWFASLLYALKQRFQAINNCLENLVENHKKANRLKTLIRGNGSTQSTLGYLDKEISKQSNTRIFMKKSKIGPLESYAKSDAGSKPPLKNKYDIDYSTSKCEIYDIVKIEVKLNNLCQLHDEICEIGKRLNQLWSYPILILMAYGFLIFTAQLYFLYCGTQGQPIPSMFRSSKSVFITAIFLFYISGKCVYLIYLSWKTSLESKRTGVCLHKFGVAVDENELYEIVNHLSLKLLNHLVDFSACGFFALNMETLYGVSGGITSYLIILIQFNLAAQQAKESNISLNNETTTISNESISSIYQDDLETTSFASTD